MGALARELHAGGAPVCAVAGVGVLVVGVEVVVDVEDDATGPLAAAHLPLDRPQPVGGEVHVVVLIRLRDRAGLVHLEEVHRDIEVDRREIGESVRGRLVRDRVGVAEILDRDRPVALGRLQGRHHVRRGHEERTGEVVRLHALTQELRVVGGFGMAEDPTRQRLQHRGPRVALRRQPAGQIQTSVSDVGDAARGLRQVGNVVQGESEVRRDVGCGALGERAAGVVDGVEDLPRPLLELGEMVVLRAHEATQRHVGAARLLRGRGSLIAEPLDLALQREHRPQRVVGHRLGDAEGRDAERLERLAAHRTLERDLHRGAFVEGLCLQQRVQ